MLNRVISTDCSSTPSASQIERGEWPVGAAAEDDDLAHSLAPSGAGHPDEPSVTAGRRPRHGRASTMGRRFPLSPATGRRTLAIYRDSDAMRRTTKEIEMTHGRQRAWQDLANEVVLGRAQHGRGGNHWQGWTDNPGWGGRRGGPGGPPPWLGDIFGIDAAPQRRRSSAARRCAAATYARRSSTCSTAPGPPTSSINGYQVIQEIAELSNGEWRPSPGSVYPTIQQLQDEGLVESDDERGRTHDPAHRRRASTWAEEQRRRARRGVGALRARRAARPQQPTGRRGSRHQERDRPGRERRLAARHPGLRPAAQGRPRDARRHPPPASTASSPTDGTASDERARSRALRIADADRERAMADLAEHYADGRLTTRSTTSASTPSGPPGPAPTWSCSSRTCRARSRSR